jgi:hypothetical protein
MWIIQQEEMLLPIAYYHVVFTLPHELNGLCMHNPSFMYDLLMKVSWKVLDQFARDPKWIGAKTATTMVLHTWSQNLGLHPHVHCIVPNGGLTQRGKWQYPKKGKNNFLFPVEAMRPVYKAIFIKALHKAIAAGDLVLPKDFPCKATYNKWKDDLYAKNWVVFTKKPFSGPTNVVNYLARYSHRVAITNHRIVHIDDHDVWFTYKDYADGAKQKTMKLSGREFLRRFVLHIVPLRFRKIRQYGYTSNACKQKSLAIARVALNAGQVILSTKKERKAAAIDRLFGTRKAHFCTKCGCEMTIIDVISPNKDPPYHDSSRAVAVESHL